MAQKHYGEETARAAVSVERWHIDEIIAFCKENAQLLSNDANCWDVWVAVNNGLK